MRTNINLLLSSGFYYSLLSNFCWWADTCLGRTPLEQCWKSSLSILMMPWLLVVATMECTCHCPFQYRRVWVCLTIMPYRVIGTLLGWAVYIHCRDLRTDTLDRPHTELYRNSFLLFGIPVWLELAMSVKTSSKPEIAEFTLFGRMKFVQTAGAILAEF